MSYGFVDAGFTPVLACDINKDATKTYIANHPGVNFILKDIHHVTGEEVLDEAGLQPGEATAVIAGPPCQGFSLAGLRDPNDPRNRLFEEFIRIAKFIKPAWIVIENVPGLLTMEQGKPVEMIYKTLSKMGYRCAHRVLNSLHYGVPQNRKRVFFLANNTEDPFPFPEATHRDPTQLSLDEFLVRKKDRSEGYKPFFTLKDAIGDLPPLKAGEQKDYYASPPSSDYQRMMRKDAPQKLYNHIAPNHTERVVNKIKKVKPGEVVPYRWGQKRRLMWDEPAPSLLDGPRPTWHLAHPRDDRGMSVRERARIMSFPDKFIFQGGVPKQRMVTGNAVPPLMAKAVALEMRKYL